MSDRYGMPTNDDRVLAIGDGNVLVHFRWKCTYPVLVYVREVHVRYYIWREALRLYQKVHVSRNDESMGGIMFLFIFRSRFAKRRKPVALRDAIGTGPL